MKLIHEDGDLVDAGDKVEADSRWDAARIMTLIQEFRNVRCS